MRYITATIGGLLMFAAIVVISVFANRLLPSFFQQMITVHLGFFFVQAPVAVLVGIVLGGLAATHSFRNTLKRYSNARNKSPVSEPQGSSEE